MYRYLLCGLVLLALPAAASAQTEAPLASPEALVERVLAANPELSSLEAQLDALGHAVAQAGVWTDPMLALEYGNMPVTAPWPGNDMMSGVSLRLQQTLPGAGKTGARTQVAEARVAVGRSQLEERRDQLAGLVQELYWQLALTRQLRVVTQDHRVLVDELLEVARVSYEVGRTAQHELLRLGVLQDQLEDQLADFDRTGRELLAALNAALHRPAGAAIATPDEVPITEPTSELDALVRQAEAHRGNLEQLEAQARVEALAADRALAERRPDVTLWAAYRWRAAVPQRDPGNDQITVGASIPLPWFWNERRWGELAQQHRAQGRAFEAQREAALDTLRGRLGAELARWQRAYDKALVYEQRIVPGARRTLESTLDAYRAGRADFASLYQSELVLLELERTVRGARTEVARAAASVATLTGLAAP